MKMLKKEVQTEMKVKNFLIRVAKVNNTRNSRGTRTNIQSGKMGTENPMIEAEMEST